MLDSEFGTADMFSLELHEYLTDEKCYHPPSQIRK